MRFLILPPFTRYSFLLPFFQPPINLSHFTISNADSESSSQPSSLTEPLITGTSTLSFPHHLLDKTKANLVPTAKSKSRNSPSRSKMARRKSKKKKRDIAAEFSRYFGKDTELENWQRLCGDLGLDDELPSIKKCRKVPSSQSLTSFSSLIAYYFTLSSRRGVNVCEGGRRSAESGSTYST